MRDVVEQQRALATLGRTYFVQAEEYVGDEKNLKQCLRKSEKSYLESLELCNKLSSNITQKEYLEMKARLYLNLG